MISAERH